jgi:hypothetical protein
MPPDASIGSELPVYAPSRRLPCSPCAPAGGRLDPGSIPQPEEAPMAHAKDKGSSKNVKKKAQKSVKEKRAEKKAKKDSASRSIGE